MRAVVIGSGERILEFACQSRARRLAEAKNVDQVVKTRRGEIVRVVLAPFSDDSLLKPRAGNSQQLCYDNETETNPRGVWELTRLYATT